MEPTIPENQAELWQIYVKGLQKLSQLWADSLRQSLESTISAVEGEQSPLSLINLYWNIYEKMFGNFLLSPSLGYTREFNNKWLLGFDSSINFYKASFDYQVVLFNVWSGAFEELMRELVSSEEKGKIQNWRQVLQVWSSVFDQVFAETFRSEDALQIRGKFLNTAITYRLNQQQMMEVFLKSNNLPIRSEVDEIHGSIYELRKEIKSLRKALVASQLP